MNIQALKLTGVSEQEYRDWCKSVGKSHYKKETKSEFFALILDKKLVRDSNSGTLIRKRVRKKKK